MIAIGQNTLFRPRDASAPAPNASSGSIASAYLVLYQLNGGNGGRKIGCAAECMLHTIKNGHAASITTGQNFLCTEAIITPTPPTSMSVQLFTSFAAVKKYWSASFQSPCPG